jgi:hypothetical protein
MRNIFTNIESTFQVHGCWRLEPDPHMVIRCHTGQKLASYTGIVGVTADVPSGRGKIKDKQLPKTYKRTFKGKQQ